MAAAMSGGVLIGTVIGSFGLALGLQWIFLESLLRVMPARLTNKARLETGRAA